MQQVRQEQSFVAEIVVIRLQMFGAGIALADFEFYMFVGFVVVVRFIFEKSTKA